MKKPRALPLSLLTPLIALFPSYVCTQVLLDVLASALMRDSQTARQHLALLYQLSTSGPAKFDVVRNACELVHPCLLAERGAEEVLTFLPYPSEGSRALGQMGEVAAIRQRARVHVSLLSVTHCVASPIMKPHQGVRRRRKSTLRMSWCMFQPALCSALPRLTPLPCACRRRGCGLGLR